MCNGLRGASCAPLRPCGERRGLAKSLRDGHFDAAARFCARPCRVGRKGKSLFVTVQHALSSHAYAESDRKRLALATCTVAGVRSEMSSVLPSRTGSSYLDALSTVQICTTNASNNEARLTTLAPSTSFPVFVFLLPFLSLSLSLSLFRPLLAALGAQRRRSVGVWVSEPGRSHPTEVRRRSRGSRRSSLPPGQAWSG